MGAGGITGLLYKSTGNSTNFTAFSHDPDFYSPSAGVRPALAAATFMSGVAGIWSYVKKNV
jgi:import inner membrane translocase subunit TIM23